jgi:PAS domain-containing protein
MHYQDNLLPGAGKTGTLETMMMAGELEQGKDERMTPPRDSQSEPRPEEFALLVDAVQDYAIFMLDPEGGIRSWNSGASRIFGYVEKEVVGRHFSLLYAPEDVSAGNPRHEPDSALRDGRV